MHYYKMTDFMLDMLLQAGVLANVVVSSFAVLIVPEVVAGPGEGEGVVLLLDGRCESTISLGGVHLLTALCYLHGKAVLVAEVVGLAVRPVGPLGRGVHVGPEPGAGVVRVVPTLNIAHIEMCHCRLQILVDL